MPNVDWDLILETIRAERCVILLGPEFATLESGRTWEEALIEHLDPEANRGLKYYPEDGLLHFGDPILRTRTYFKVKAFYREIAQNKRPEQYEKLARIPFHLFISTSPDDFLPKTFDKLGISHQYSFYNRTTNPESLINPAKDSPLVYNLFGSIEEEQSMILSHGDLYDFLFAILGDHRLPDALQDSLHKAANIIFLGFNFGKWYMQLLLRMLNLHEEGYSFDRYASADDLDKDVRIFVNEQFKINFVEGSVSDFVDLMYEKCEAAGLIRDLNAPRASVFDQVNDLLEQDELGNVLKILQDYFELKKQEELQEEIILLSGRYKRLQRKINQEIIDSKEAELSLNKIRVALLDLNKEARDLT